MGDIAEAVINKTIDLFITSRASFARGLSMLSSMLPCTTLAKRLPRDDTGINKLDAACKRHDII